MKQLRDYQLELVQKIVQSMKSGHHSIMVQSPAGSGKTIVMSDVARRTTLNHKRVMFVVHRKEIVNQVIKTFDEQCVDLDLCDIGMVQTFSRRLDKLKAPDVILVDEAHHALAKSYTKILHAYPEATKLLFTATPVRLSGQGFETIVDDLIVGKPIKWLIDHHNLAPFEYYAPADIDLSKLKTKSTGDFDNDSVDEALKPQIFGNAVRTYNKVAKGTQAIAYTHNVAAAKSLADEFNRQGIPANYVHGGTPAQVRDDIVDQFKAGKIKMIANAELFTEGLDLPAVETVIMLRPTQSLSLYIQFSMRSMRYLPNKTAKIIDHVGNVMRFGLPDMDRRWSIEGKSKAQMKREKVQLKASETIQTCATCFGTFYKDQLIDGNCPYCGAQYIAQKVEYTVDEKRELKRIDKEIQKSREEQIKRKTEARVADKRPEELKSLVELQAFARIRDYKPGWAYFYAKKRGIIK